MSAIPTLRILEQQIVECRKCPRLVGHREKVARVKRRAFRGESYWGRPVPGFGDPQARLLIVGLAPAAHGANRTGRMFTGDRSGEFLYARLHEAGFANQAESRHRRDGLRLRDAWISATARCAPPGNKPLPSEIANCRAWLEAEMDLLRPRAVLALGKIAFDACLRMMEERGAATPRPRPVFRHGAKYDLAAGGARGSCDFMVRLFVAYHPSQQNTQTGRVTKAMYRKVLRGVTSFLGGKAPGGEARLNLGDLDG